MDDQSSGQTGVETAIPVHKARFRHSGLGKAVKEAPDGVTTKGFQWRIAAVNTVNLQAGPPRISSKVSTPPGGVTAG